MILHSVVIACIHIDFDTLTGLQFQNSKERRIFLYNNEWYCLLHKSPFRRKGFIFIIHKDTLKIDRLSSPLSHYLINLDHVLWIWKVDYICIMKSLSTWMNQWRQAAWLYTMHRFLRTNTMCVGFVLEFLSIYNIERATILFRQ